jgi:hypothetical protein
MRDGTTDGNEKAWNFDAGTTVVETPAMDEAPVLEAGAKGGAHRGCRGIDRT